MFQNNYFINYLLSCITMESPPFRLMMVQQKFGSLCA
ncbi:hypothetical protein BIW11_04148 [Tropilaelaps mercedesae]|uniref:Uncharacterized protein n=1 Tax=Tropilaelaps mercedesae TaxID=418985 RepID=A0A1V9XAN0_9ACAR|nr:hypothetical protein BIW11_04148 [Tropilaelaps mercedesae]